MRLHTDTHTWSTIYDALQRAKDNGRVARTVYLEECEERGSRKKARAFEITLRSWDKAKGDGRRRPNTGRKGHDDRWAATYDEWGYFIAELFAIDPDAIFGSYVGQAGFDADTRHKYDAGVPA